jgi:hypothetical protein
LEKEYAMAKRVWTAPKVEKMSAGDAEANGVGIDDGGPVGNARS